MPRLSSGLTKSLVCTSAELCVLLGLELRNQSSLDPSRVEPETLTMPLP